MFICSNAVIPVGTIVRDRVYKDVNGNLITNHPFYILREITKQEWLDHHDDPPTPEMIAEANRRGYTHFYEVSTD